MIAHAQNQLSPEIWIVVLVGLPFFFCVVSICLSLLGGWHSLAKRFSAEPATFRIEEESKGKSFVCASMEMGSRLLPVNYGNCVIIRVDHRGIRLKVWPMFRILHPPLEIPWSAIEGCEMQKAFLLWPRTAIYVSGFRHPLRIYGRAGKEIHNQWSQCPHTVQLVGQTDAEEFNP